MKTMRPEVRNTLILILVFVALLAGWWLLETYKPGQQAAETPGAGKYLFATLAPEDVEGLEVKLRSGPSLYIFKGADGWQLGGVGGDRLDEYAVEDGVQALAGLQAQRVFTQNVNLPDFGLDVPTGTITLTVAREAAESVLVGKSNPDGSSYYVQRAGHPEVYLVTKSTIDTVLGWANKPPLAPTPTPAALVTVVATLTPTPPGPTGPVTATVIVTPTSPPTPTATATLAGTVITVVVTPTPQPSGTPVITPTVTVTPTAVVTPPVTGTPMTLLTPRATVTPLPTTKP